jgi:hypothetical protein
MALLRRKSVFAAKIEGTVGTAETLAGTDGAFNAREFTIQPNIPVTRREGQGGFNYLPGIPEGMQGTCTVTIDLSYDGTTVPSWATTLLPACGWVNDGGLFSPVTQGPGGAGGVKTITIGHYLDGKLKRLSGAMGTFTINCPTGKIAFIQFTFTGKYYVDETDTAIIAPTYPTALPLRFADGTVTFDSVGLCLANLNVDAGNTVVMRECVEDGNRTGFRSAIVTDRAPVITGDPESVLVATQNRDNLWLTSDTGALVSTLNGVSDSTVVITAAAAQLENKQQGDRNGIATDDLTWLATQGASADTELTIEFNEAT